MHGFYFPTTASELEQERGERCLINMQRRSRLLKQSCNLLSALIFTKAPVIAFWDTQEELQTFSPEKDTRKVLLGDVRFIRPEPPSLH